MIQARRWLSVLHNTENGIVVIALFLMAVLPVIEIFSRLAGVTGISGSTEYVRHLTLWIGFLGAIIAARENKHLSLHAGIDALPETARRWINVGTGTLATAVCAALAWSGLEFLKTEWEYVTNIAGWLPQWAVIAIMPAGFVLVAVRLTWHGSAKWWGRLIIATGPLFAAAFGLYSGPEVAADLLVPGLILIFAAGALGSPIFVIIGGMALLLFFADDIPVAAIPVEAYRIVASPVLPTIPLFTLAGYILAEGGASKRFVRLFSALFGWMPGGAAVAATVVCAFFTTFTGASGVTILALGGLLLPVLLQSGFKERFSIGLLTSTGSLGLLFPPSLSIILYGVVSNTPIDQLFIAGFIPGMLLLLAVSLFGVQQGIRSKKKRTPFDVKEAFRAMWSTKWELILPFVVLFGIFGGYTTLVEAAAITVVYALITQMLIYRDLEIRSNLVPVFVNCAVLVGGILLILTVAMGLTSYLVDAEIPFAAANWVKANIESQIVFLLALNAFLLIVGCLMDIFSAIIVVVPLLIPMGEVFGIHPLHLGIIFQANLQLGYLTPPVGMNLFLASYRFDRSLMEVYRDTVPFFILLVIIVLMITYMPSLTLALIP